MAVIARTRVSGVDQARHDQLQQAVGEGIGRAGGPHPGLMAHIGHPDGDDLVVVEVFDNEASFHEFWADVIGPALASLDLAHGEHDIQPVWSFARP